MADNKPSTNLNTSPWYDDFNAAKDFYRILFVPGVAVQARELTQIQTILQTQVSRLAQHLFKEGSITEGGQFIFDKKFKYMKLMDADPLSNPVSVSDFVGVEVFGITSGVRAEIFTVSNGSESTSAPKTLFFKYKAGNGSVKAFIPGETISTDDGFQAVIINDPEAVGATSLFTIEEGIVFAKGHMLRFANQSIVLDPYSDKPSYKVGFVVEEDTIDAIDDQSLLDPAQGSSNYAAPGADRLKISLSLIKYNLESSTSPDFIELFEIKEGITQEQFEKPQYSVIRDTLADRMADDAGDFYVRGWNVSAREHFDNGVNGGLYTANTGGNSSFLAIGVDPGKGYIKGYDAETLVTRYVSIPKGLDTKNVEQQIVSTNYANYIIVNELVGNWPINTATTLTFYDTAMQRISQNRYSATAQSGNIIGTAKVKAVEHINGTKGLSTAQYRIYLFDVNITSTTLKFKDIKSVYIDNASTADAGADIVLESGLAYLYEPDFNYGVYDIGLRSIKTIRDESNQIDTTYAFVKSFDVNISTAGTFTLNSGATDEVFSYSTGPLNATQKNDFLLSLNSAINVTMAGTVATSTSNGIVTGTSTNFTRLNVGDKVTITGVSGTYRILSITSDTSMTLTSNPASAVSGATYVKAYLAGDVIDFRLNGAAGGVLRTIDVNSPTSISFDMKETLSGAVTATVIAKLNKTDAREIAKNLRSDRYVIINCGTAGTAGPFNLGISDAFRIKSVRLKSGSTFGTTSEGTDVTTQFRLDNGQRDTHYDHAALIKAGATLTSSSYLLVKLDYFYPNFSQGAGYFSVDSYPIDDVSPSSTTAIKTEQIPVYRSTTSGRLYDLRNSIDTRPVKTNTAADVTTLTGISTNPGTTNSFVSAAGGLRTPAPSEEFLIDLGYYLPRKDLIVIDKNGAFRAVRGVSDTLPRTPETPSDAMSLAVVNVSPYPSLVSTYASLIQRLDLSVNIDKTSNRRYTHRDVGVIAQDVRNLQYYQALTLLEKSVLDMKIPDDNGLDRFKNGIFVDPFNDHSLGDLGNADYDIAIDPLEKALRPKFRSDAIDSVLASSSGVLVKNNVISLPYTEISLVSQPFATSTRNAAGFFWNFKGKMEIQPATDYWTDTTIAPSIQVTSGPSAQAWQSLAAASGSVWSEWNTTWTGIDTTSQTNTGATWGVANGSAFNQGPGTTVTTTLSGTQSSSRTVTNVITNTQTESLGERVIDVGVVPFMRSRAVWFAAYGLQPSTRVFAFFDGEPVAQYVQLANSTGALLGTSVLTTNADGEIYGWFTIPNNETKRFRVGDRVFRLTDSIINSTDAITVAEATYSASGLVQQKQTTFLTTTNPTFSSSVETQTRETSTTSTTFIPNVTAFNGNPNTSDTRGGGGDNGGAGGGGADPIAQTFSVNSILTSHLFLTGIDLFFQTKHPTLGMNVELRELDGSGQITGKVIPYSNVYVNASDVNVSDDASLPTNVKFGAPICLTSGQDYAFVVLPEQSNPNYRMFTAKLGENDLTTGNRVTSQPYSGIMFLSANNKSWSPVQDEDIKFRLYRAQFTVGSGSFQIKNGAREIIKGSSITGTWVNGADVVYGETLLTIGTITGGTPVVGNKVVQGTNTASIISIAGGVYRVRGIDAHKIVNGAVSFTTAGDVSLGITGAVSSAVTQTCQFEKIITKRNGDKIFVFSNPSRQIIVGEVLTRSNGDTVTVASFESLSYSLIDFETSALQFPQTSISWGYTGRNASQILDGNATLILPTSNKKFSSEKRIYGRSQELSDLSGGASIYYDCSIVSNNEYVSPVIDLNRTYTIYVENLINNDLTGEAGTSGGNAWNKYISQKIELASENDAEDMKIFFSGYRPSNSNISVYVKLLNAEDKETFDNKNWILMTPKSASLYSSDENEYNYKEFEYNLPASMKTGALGEVEYTNAAGAKFLGYRYYMIKIVLTGTDTAAVPKVKGLRCLALQI